MVQGGCIPRGQRLYGCESWEVVEGSGEVIESALVTKGGVVEKIVVGWSSGHVRRNVEKIGMDAYATCNFSAMHIKETKE